MGLNFSAQLDSRMQDYLRGRADEVVDDLRPLCRRCCAAAFLNQVSSEMEMQASRATQLLRNKESGDTDQVISSGYIMQYVGHKRKWKEKYFVMKGSYLLECFETKETAQRGVRPDSEVRLSGCILLSEASDYRQMLSQSWPAFNGAVDSHLEEQHMNFPTRHHLFLWHAYRPHLLLSFRTEDDSHTWGMFLADGVRRLNTVLFGRDSFEARVFLEAVRGYRERNGRYGTCDLYLGSETEILTNLVMEDLCPVLESQLIPHVRGPESKRKQTWLRMLGAIFAVVEGRVSERFPALVQDNKEQRQRLERAVRPDLSQILTSKKQLGHKIQASVEERVRDFCREQVEPQLGSVRDTVATSIRDLLAETRTLFSQDVSEVISAVKSGGDNCSLPQVGSQLLEFPHPSAQLHHCYRKTSELEQYLGEVAPPFTFDGVHFLVQRAQNIVQQLTDDAVYTFQHTLASLQPAMGLPAEINQLLDNTRVLVLKKLDSDSNTAGRQFVRDTLLELALPYVLKNLDPVCKPELAAYESYVPVDDEGVIQIESIYKELVLHIVSEEINKAMKVSSTRPEFSLYNESTVHVWDGEAQHSIAEHSNSTRPTSPTDSPALGTSEEHRDEIGSTSPSGNDTAAGAM
ncbi:protein Niban 1-like [Rhinoraja longicauda]